MYSYDTGERLYTEERYEEAIVYFKQALEDEEDKTSALNYIGCCYINLERYYDALKVFDELLDFRLWERPLFNKGRVYLKLANYSEALACFNRALMINPEESDVYYYLGVYHDKIGDYNTSKYYYEKAIDIEYNDSEYHLNLAVACFRTNDLNRALEESNISISLDDSNSNADAFCNKAYILYKTKNYEESLDTYLKVIRLNPNDTETMNMIANCYAYLKEYNKCLNWLDQILGIDCSNEEAIEHKKVIESLFAKRGGY
jgi:tetratricopeptide (TPR) repeat protein